MNPEFTAPLTDGQSAAVLLDDITRIALDNLDTDDTTAWINDATDYVAEIVQSIDWPGLTIATAGIVNATEIGRLISQWVLCVAAKDEFVDGSVARQRRYVDDLAAGQIDSVDYNALLDNERDLIDMNEERLDAELQAALHGAFEALLDLGDLLV